MFDLYNKKTGLSIDYMNEWYKISNFLSMFESGLSDKDEFSELVGKPLRSYEQHFREKHPQFADEALEIANPKSIELIDSLCEKFNNKDIKEKIDKAVIERFVKKAIEIIEGNTEIII